MDHTIQKYFSLQIGVVTQGFLHYLLGDFNIMKRKRLMKMRINSLKYLIITFTYRINLASDFIDQEGHIKLSTNSSKEFIKLELC